MDRAVCDTIRVVSGDPDLAGQKANVTRDAIAAAVVELLVETHPSNLSVPDVARAAGVSVRTVYRYFPSKSALLDHVASEVYDSLEKVGAGAEATGLFSDPDQWVPELWRTFGERVDTLRAQHIAPMGAELRDRRLGRNREAVAKVLAERYPAATPDDLATLADLNIAVTSSRMFLELHDRMGWPVDDAGALAAWLLRAIAHEYEHGGLP